MGTKADFGPNIFIFLEASCPLDHPNNNEYLYLLGLFLLLLLVGGGMHFGSLEVQHTVDIHLNNAKSS